MTNQNHGWVRKSPTNGFLKCYSSQPSFDDCCGLLYWYFRHTKHMSKLLRNYHHFDAWIERFLLFHGHANNSIVHLAHLHWILFIQKIITTLFSFVLDLAYKYQGSIYAVIFALHCLRQRSYKIFILQCGCIVHNLMKNVFPISRSSYFQIWLGSFSSLWAS